MKKESNLLKIKKLKVSSKLDKIKEESHVEREGEDRTHVRHEEIGRHVGFVVLVHSRHNHQVIGRGSGVHNEQHEYHHRVTEEA